MPDQGFYPATHMNATSSHTQPAPEMPRSGEERDAQLFPVPRDPAPQPRGTREAAAPQRDAPPPPPPHPRRTPRHARARVRHGPPREGRNTQGPDRTGGRSARPQRRADPDPPPDTHLPPGPAGPASSGRQQEVPPAGVAMEPGTPRRSPRAPTPAEPAGLPSLSDIDCLRARSLGRSGFVLTDAPQGAAREETRVDTPARAQYRNLQHSPESESAAFESFTVHGSTACPETLYPSQRQRPRTGHSTAGLEDTGRAKARCQSLPPRHRPPRRGPSAPRSIRPLRGGSVLPSVPTADPSAFHQPRWKAGNYPLRHAAAAMTPQ
ncbi:basic salivary proline-rich protein 4-like [Pyrgilauda ruficollis]|uniref:basic salivary proline-rich protein 4-like n=1 Tax=Pyrgilauda ruficollis TaxID=221976 RepID=UPI001B8819B5|nr:basic salivary proline-rich protein 4-like [Pyrgilauda ruficollis]